MKNTMNKKPNTLRKLIAAATVAATTLMSGNALAESSVWKVSKGDDHVFIGGTVHILPADQFPLPVEFENAYKQSDAIVLETKLPDPQDQAAQMALLQRLSYSDGKRLSHVLSKETYNSLGEYLAEFGANVKELDGFKPGFIISMVAMMEAQRAQLAGEGVDAYFNKKAASESKPIEYLESLEFQLDMLANMGKDNEDTLIRSTLNQMSSFKEMFTALLPAWRAGDMKKIDDLMIKPVAEEDPATFKTLFTDRNMNWVPLIEKMFEDQDREFVLVGAGHLAGDKNVIELLANKGYKVTKL